MRCADNIDASTASGARGLAHNRRPSSDSRASARKYHSRNDGSGNAANRHAGACDYRPSEGCGSNTSSTVFSDSGKGGRIELGVCDCSVLDGSSSNAISSRHVAGLIDATIRDRRSCIAANDFSYATLNSNACSPTSIIKIDGPRTTSCISRYVSNSPGSAYARRYRVNHIIRDRPDDSDEHRDVTVRANSANGGVLI